MTLEQLNTAAERHQLNKALPVAEIVYLVYYNDFLTIARFAEYYEMTTAEALQLIETGRIINHKRSE